MVLKIIQNLRTQNFCRNRDIPSRNVYLRNNKILPLKKVERYLKWEQLKDDIVDFFARLFKRKKV